MMSKLSVLLLTFLSLSQSIGFAQDHVNIFMIARNTGVKGLANSDTIRVFGFAENLSAQPNVPGPTIIAKEGDSVHIDLWNVSQGAPHTIHLHGLDVDQANDGVPHLSFDIPHMEHGYYNFKAPHAGTYLYHCHVASTIHVQAGMYGLIIIKPSDGGNTTWNNGYAYEREHSYFLSEIDTNWHQDSVLNHEHDTSGTIHSIAIPEYKPQFFLINGYSDQQLEENDIALNSAANEVNYLRLTNIGFYGTRVIFPPGLNAKTIDSDGRPLNTIEVADTILVFPGERFGVLAESSVEMEGEIQFEYFDLNTFEIKNTQVVEVSISGFAKIIEAPSDFFEFAIVPNPMDESAVLNFHLDKAQKIELHIYDITGKLVVDKVLQNTVQGSNSVPIGGFLVNKGIYHIELVLENKQKGLKTGLNR
jgi:plastocyanin